MLAIEVMTFLEEPQLHSFCSLSLLIRQKGCYDLDGIVRGHTDVGGWLLPLSSIRNILLAITRVQILS